MNSKERVKRAFKHMEPDKVPVSELYINSPVASEILGRDCYVGWGGLIRAKIFNKMLMEGTEKDFYKKEVIDLVDLYRTLGLDTIIIERPPLKNQIVPVEINEVSWKFEDNENGFWNIMRYTPTTDNYGEVDSSIKRGGVKEFERYINFLDEQTIDLEKWDWDQAEYIMNTCGKDKFIMAVVEIDFPPTAFLSWGDVFMECMVLRPDLVERYLDYRVRKGVKFIRKYAKMGVDCIFCGEDWAGNSGLIFSPDHFRRFYQPRVKLLIEEAHKNNLLYMKHTDGNLMSIEKEFFNELGIDAYQSVDPEARMDINYLKKKYGNKITIMGNVDCSKVLHFGTPKDVMQETKWIINSC